MQVLLYQQKVDDKKHKVEFMKDKISYRGKTFDAVIGKDFRKTLAADMATRNLKYPLELELADDDYFTKFVQFTRNDKTTGTKVKVVITNAQSIEQGKFDNKSLDEVCDNIEEERAKSLADVDDDTDDGDDDEEPQELPFK